MLRKYCYTMKLELNENTLSAYINEAIKQELNEAYKVDFDSLGGPHGTVQRWHHLKWYTTAEKAKEAMANGTYGRTGWMEPRELVADLKTMGYTDSQIQNGIKSGAITIGKNYGTDKFVPHDNLRKQNRRTARLMTAAGMPVQGAVDNNQEVTSEVPKETPGSGLVRNEFPWDDLSDNQIAWGQNRLVKQQAKPAQTPQQPAQKTAAQVMRDKPTVQQVNNPITMPQGHAVSICPHNKFRSKPSFPSMCQKHDR